MVNKKTVTKKKWTFYENAICCYVYKEYFIINKSIDLKGAIDKIDKIFRNSIPRTSIKQKMQNIKEIMNSKGLKDTFPMTSRPHYSKDNKEAFDIII